VTRPPLPPVQCAAVPGDLPAVAAIYRPYVESSVITFEVDPPDAESWRRRFDGLEARRLPFLVAETAATVVGWCGVHEHCRGYRGIQVDA